MVSLHDFLDQQEQANETFVVDNEQKANWVLRKIKALEEKKSSNLALAESEVAKIEAWLEMVNGQLDQDLEYFRGLLHAYAIGLRETDPKFKSLKLPNGKISLRKQLPKWNYEEKTLLQFIKETGRMNLIRIKEELDKNAIKKAFEIQQYQVIDPETGEVVEGVSIEYRDDELKVEVFDL